MVLIYALGVVIERCIDEEYSSAAPLALGQIGRIVPKAKLCLQSGGSIIGVLVAFGDGLDCAIEIVL